MDDRNFGLREYQATEIVLAWLRQQDLKNKSALDLYRMFSVSYSTIRSFQYNDECLNGK